jgi:hypothetical protein
LGHTLDSILKDLLDCSAAFLAAMRLPKLSIHASIRQQTSADVIIRQHTSTYVRMRFPKLLYECETLLRVLIHE